MVDGWGTAMRGAGSTTAAERWGTFFRWGPYGLLALATSISAATAPVLMTRGGMIAAGALVPVALGLQLWWGRLRPRVPEHAPAGRLYFGLRTVLGFVLTWMNPLFSIYATMGYFDAIRLLPPRQVRFGLLVTAVTVAGSQSGGLPPRSGGQWLLFGVVFAVHAALSTIFGNLGEREAAEARAKAATMAELESTNARLAQALDENAGLHAQLLVQAREAGVDEERRRMAAEIHDTIAQGLAGIITQLQAVSSAEDPAAAQRHLDRAQALARQSLGEARRSVHGLGPGALEHDALGEALRKTVDEWSERVGVRAEFTVTGTAEPLHEEIEATLLRIAQEALANAARHAEAARVGVTLSYMDDEVTLDVRDDGRGFDPLDLPPRSESGGFGLGGMRARAERLAGRVDLESEPGGGTAVSARVPLVRHD
ncbi:sensor histidine kinase [Kitasatospora sp. NPDC101183]|uniref:sensor histidine kinase n=1 Tax=Kitasatospora sp. NPDC101183 TaxID=3364100 RepID=UPI0037F9500C